MKTILSFDVDRTLVDRETSSHSLSLPIKEALLEACDSRLVDVVLNTGRDLTALGEFDAVLGRELNALFLSGRAGRLDGNILVDKSAVLSISLIEKAFEISDLLSLPFLDLKTGRGVVHIPFHDAAIEFGMQKPADWYRVTSPRKLDSRDPQTIEIIESLEPVRLEIPCRRSVVERVKAALEIDAGHSVEESPVHKDYADHKLGDWVFLQILSPIDNNNKGAALKDYVQRVSPSAMVVHFGDSDSHHNSDTLVLQFIPTSRYVQIDWKRQDKLKIEETITQEIRSYL